MTPAGRHLLIINPNTTGAMTEKIGEAARAAADAGTRITAINPVHGPAAIQGADDGAAALPGLFSLVDEVLDAGAGAAVASLWRASDAETTWLVRDFYVNLEAAPDPLAALFATKRRFMEAYEGRQNREWAAFQLYLP